MNINSYTADSVETSKISQNILNYKLYPQASKYMSVNLLLHLTKAWLIQLDCSAVALLCQNKI